MTELVLGTAQLGEGYGITNTTGRLDDTTVSELLTTAVDAGISLVDTAEAYGDAESRLGALMPAPARYVTKFGLEADGAPDLDALITRSATRLGVESLYGILLHRVADLADPRFAELHDQLRAARDAGRVQRIGVSIYDADDLHLALEAFPGLDLLQIPGSAVDTRLLDHPLIAEAAARGVEIHVRSVFLQGLLLQPAGALPARFAELVPVVQALDAAAAERSTDRLSLVLAAVRRDEVAGAIVGATSAAELRDITRAWNAHVEPVRPIADVSHDILDPRRWAR